MAVVRRVCSWVFTPFLLTARHDYGPRVLHLHTRRVGQRKRPVRRVFTLRCPTNEVLCNDWQLARRGGSSLARACGVAWTSGVSLTTIIATRLKAAKTFAYGVLVHYGQAASEAPRFARLYHLHQKQSGSFVVTRLLLSRVPSDLGR